MSFKQTLRDNYLPVSVKHWSMEVRKRNSTEDLPTKQHFIAMYISKDKDDYKVEDPNSFSPAVPIDLELCHFVSIVNGELEIIPEKDWERAMHFLCPHNFTSK